MSRKRKQKLDRMSDKREFFSMGSHGFSIKASLSFRGLVGILALGVFSFFPRTVDSRDLEDRYGKFRDKPGWPLGIFSPISGTFGEYRNYNMHMGADFKTYGLNGIPILATYDGYMKYISQRDKGYGRSFHVYSPELGLVTKYAHMFSYLGEKKDLERLRIALCMLNGKDEFSINLPSNRFPVKKGEWIGLSGETGTGGPHLHLEFRDGGGFINPLFFSAFNSEDHHPPTILKLIWEDSASSRNLEWEPEESMPGQYSIPDTIQARGKIRIKIRGYDWIRSRNRNNVYAFELFQGEESIYRKEFSYVPYSDSYKRYLYYDTNRSSLSPPIYFYNLFDYQKGYSIDLSKKKPGEKIQLRAVLEDAAGQKSILPLQVEVVANLVEAPRTNQPASSGSGKLFRSYDGAVELDLRKYTTYGSGNLEITPVDWKEEKVKIPKGLSPTSLAYKISAQNFNWKGKATGRIRLNRQPTKKETLYFFDTSIQRFKWIKSWKTQDGFRFQTEKLGIVGILADDAKPSVEYIYQFGTRVHLPDASIPGMIERYYYLSDVGSGFTTRPDVYLEGENYPYEYDRDRRAIRILIPRKAFLRKKFLILQIRPKDWAGNVGKYFTEVLSLPEKDR